MSSPLDLIEARWLKNAEINPARFDGPRRRIAELTLREAQDVLALVKVARAAETVWTSIGHAAWCGSIEGEPCDCGQTALREALAVLNKEPA